jgi:dephospho-CoA kinase
VSTPYLIGLTGGIGSGKSTVASYLEALGAEIISGDDLGKIVLEGSPELLAKIRERFGDDVFDDDGQLLRRALGERVFANSDNALWLTHLTFPGIHRLLRERTLKSVKDVVVFDAALIFEWGIQQEFDLLLIVQAARDRVVQRLAAGGRLSAGDIEARLASQISPDVKAQSADAVLTNDGSLKEIQRKVDEIWTTRVLPELQRRRMRENGSFC